MQAQLQRKTGSLKSWRWPGRGEILEKMSEKGMGGNFHSIKMSVQIYVYQVNVINSYLKKSNEEFQNEGRGQRSFGLFPKKHQFCEWETSPTWREVINRLIHFPLNISFYLNALNSKDVTVALIRHFVLKLNTVGRCCEILTQNPLGAFNLPTFRPLKEAPGKIT